MPDYEWTRDDRGVDMYGKDYPFDAGDKHNFEWVLKNFEELCDTFPDVARKYCVDTEAVKKPLYHIDNKRKFNPAFDEYMHPEEAYKPDF